MTIEANPKPRSRARVAFDATLMVLILAIVSGVAFFVLIFLLSLLKLAWEIAP